MFVFISVCLAPQSFGGEAP